MNPRHLFKHIKLNISAEADEEMKIEDLVVFMSINVFCDKNYFVII